MHAIKPPRVLGLICDSLNVHRSRPPVTLLRRRESLQIQAINAGTSTDARINPIHKSMEQRAINLAPPLGEGERSHRVALRRTISPKTIARKNRITLKRKTK